MSAQLFERRHFVALANIIEALPDHAPSLRACKESVASHFADRLAVTNTNFDRERFLAAAKGSPVTRRDE